jgi:predicted nucleotidyltransferase
MTARLPRWAQEFVDKVVSACEQDPRILGVTIGGSAVTGTMDVFSDLDFLIICTNDGCDEVLAGARDLAATLGPLLVAFTGEHVRESRLLIGVFGPPLRHVDLKFVTLADLATRVEDGLLLWARDARVGDALQATAAVWPALDPQWIEDRFWVWVHYTATKLGRGELFEVIDSLAFMRSAVFGPLLAAQHGQRPQGVRRIEQYAPEAVPELVATIGDHTQAGCISALRATIVLYRRLRVAGSPQIEHHTAAEVAAVAYLDEISEKTRG